MGDRVDHTAVSAGTGAGSAWDPHSNEESRAAEAATDDHLESLRTTGARMPAAPVGTMGQSVRPAEPAAPGEGSRSPHGPEAGLHPERPRDDLSKNQAGIASRLDAKKGGG